MKWPFSVFYEGPKLWRDLSLEIKNSENQFTFKERLEKKIFADFDHDQIVYEWTITIVNLLIKI